MKILIVEDEIRISNLLKIYLSRESYQVTVTDNGDDGLAQALQEDYDLIILDVFMPGKNGFTVLEEVRKLKDTPVIMLSAQNEEQGLGLGANAFISKPFSPGAVVSKVKEILSAKN
ncbi:response regulator transcription factor [Neobacillus dielmonensis]|uniref:response regulator transcription factor n=1 Tax=Neobacillus dielmonensis TaxID=1347369 RepID=UPI000694D30D|nr:response regulator [Neobacillus dielmonensis]